MTIKTVKSGSEASAQHCCVIDVKLILINICQGIRKIKIFFPAVEFNHLAAAITPVVLNSFILIS